MKIFWSFRCNELGGDEMKPHSNDRCLRVDCFVAVGFALLVFCKSASAIASGGQTPEDRYYALIDKADRLYLEGRLDTMRETLREIDNLRVVEVPKYEPLLFEAILLGQQNRREEALVALAAFRDMLRVDSGVAKCDVKDTIKIDGVRMQSPKAFRTMCAEAYLAYYESPALESLRRIARYWSLADNLRTQLEADSVN